MNWVQENQYVDGYSGKDQPSFPERSSALVSSPFYLVLNFFLHVQFCFFVSD